MAFASKELFDFLTTLDALEFEAKEPVEVYRKADRALYDYLDKLGVDQCNYGVFETNDGVCEPVQFANSRLSPQFLDEYSGEHMERDDFVMLASNALDERCPVARFRIGRQAAMEWPTKFAASSKVQLRCADQGIEDGIAYIGRTQRGKRHEIERFFGFVYATSDPHGGKVVRDRIDEIQLATHAFMNRCLGIVEAITDEYSFGLTVREVEILRLLADGCQREQIAERRSLSVSTVDFHLGNLRKKLGASTLAEAVAKAFRYGVLR